VGEIRAEVEVDEAARLLARLVDSIDRETDAAVDEIGDDSEVIYAAHALKKTGRLARGIKARRAGRLVLVEAHAKNPKDGFDYVAVTRFGHLKAIIRPRWDRAQASVVATRGKRRQRRGAALRLAVGGNVFYRASVRGFRPHGDWAEAAFPEVERNAARVTDRLGARLFARFGT
jgi:hypothetical protein